MVHSISIDLLLLGLVKLSVCVCQWKYELCEELMCVLLGVTLTEAEVVQLRNRWQNNVGDQYEVKVCKLH